MRHEWQHIKKAPSKEVKPNNIDHKGSSNSGGGGRGNPSSAAHTYSPCLQFGQPSAVPEPATATSLPSRGCSNHMRGGRAGAGGGD
mmetsp:Transcript_31812/g.70671  ORF Transcript_31812/g.70671 Transcript_31812/m.70671 type:complete len:86 (-) Transcript_31812:2467-2724(-)